MYGNFSVSVKTDVKQSFVRETGFVVSISVLQVGLQLMVTFAVGQFFFF